MRTQEQHRFGKRGIIIKALQNNKKLLVSAIIAILLKVSEAMFNIFVLVNSICCIIALLLVVGSFVCNLNDKPKLAIACAAVSAIAELSSALLMDYSASSILISILNTFPQIMLIVFLLKQEKNVQTWLYLTWIAVFLPEIVHLGLIIIYTEYPFTVLLCNIIIYLLRNTLPLGFVYCFGYTANNDATQQPDAVQKTTASSYLEAYKLNRKNGGK